MAIQMRRGQHALFDKSKLLPGEWAIVLSGDPASKDGKAAYVCFAAGDVKRVATVEDMAELVTAQVKDMQGAISAEVVDAATGEVAEVLTNAKKLVSDIEAARDSGELSGATYTPCVSAAGVLSWINDKGLPNPSPANVKGPKGDKGDKGATGPKGDAGDGVPEGGSDGDVLVRGASDAAWASPVAEGDVANIDLAIDYDDDPDAMLPPNVVLPSRRSPLTWPGLKALWRRAKAAFAPLSHTHAASDVEGGLLPEGGEPGQVMGVGADGDPAWQDAPVALPAGGKKGDVLVKASDADGDAAWLPLVDGRVTTSAIFDAGEGAWEDGAKQLVVSQAFGGQLVLPDSAPVREGYDLAGWVADGGSAATEDTEVDWLAPARFAPRWHVNARPADLTWAQIAERSADAVAHPEEYEHWVGQSKALTIDGEGYGEVAFQVIGIAHDDLADGSGKAGFTFQSVPTMPGHQINSAQSTSGGWANASIRAWMNGSLLAAFQEDARSVMRSVVKRYQTGYRGGIADCEDVLWLPSLRELYPPATYAEGDTYQYWLAHNAVGDRAKATMAGGKSSWLLRSVNDKEYYKMIGATGGIGTAWSISTYSISPCFCV